MQTRHISRYIGTKQVVGEKKGLTHMLKTSAGGFWNFLEQGFFFFFSPFFLSFSLGTIHTLSRYIPKKNFFYIPMIWLCYINKKEKGGGDFILFIIIIKKKFF